MRKVLAQSVSILVVSGCLGASTVSAEPITVTAGEVIAQAFGGSFTFTGAGLSLSGGVPDGFRSALFNCSPCSPVNPIILSLASSITGGDFAGGYPGEVNGLSYARTYLGGSMTFNSIAFSSALLSPSNTSISAPFTFSGTLFGCPVDCVAASGPNLFEAQLIGAGTATATFLGPVNDAEHGPLYDGVQIAYDFSDASPTPEPGSLLLLGSGAAFLLRKRRP